MSGAHHTPMVLHDLNSTRHTAKPVRPGTGLKGQAQSARGTRVRFAEANAVSKGVDGGCEKPCEKEVKILGKK